MAKRKPVNISNDQLAQMNAEKQTGNIIQSSIKKNESFIRTTLYRDIKNVFFHKEKPGEVSDIDCGVIFCKLLNGGFIQQSTTSTQTTIPIYQCLKTWNSNSLSV